MKIQILQMIFVFFAFFSTARDAYSFDYINSCDEIDTSEFYSIVKFYVPSAELKGGIISFEDGTVIDIARAPELCSNSNPSSPAYILEYVTAVGETEFYAFFVWNLNLADATEFGRRQASTTPGGASTAAYIQVDGEKTVVVNHNWAE